MPFPSFPPTPPRSSPPLSPPTFSSPPVPPPTKPSPSPRPLSPPFPSFPPLVKGHTWFVVHRPWFACWLDFRSQPPSPSRQALPPIDSSSLLAPGSSSALRPGILVGIHCEVVPTPLWSLLVDTYGLANPQSLIPRLVVAPGGPGSEVVELYPPLFILHFLLSDPLEQTPRLAPPPSAPGDDPGPIRLHFSIGLSFLDLIRALAQKFFRPIPDANLPSRPIRLWRLSDVHQSPHSVDRPRWLTLEQCLHSGLQLEPVHVDSDSADLNHALLTDPINRLLVEECNPDLSWTLVSDPSTLNSSPSALQGDYLWLQRMDRLNSVNHSDPQFKSHLSPPSPPNGRSISPNTNTTFPHPQASLPTAFPSRSPALPLQQPSSYHRYDTYHSRRIRGLVGLANLGNTCFMNSALQCLSNCPELKRYFLSRVYISELNKVNPLGMGGKVAESFGQLIEKIWSDDTAASVAPREFKSIVGRFNSLFLGYGQQDSQELLTFLLDALHEDLNRVIKKPFDEIPDFQEGGGDQELIELAETCWRLYRRRNDSVIVDLFQGQFKSTLVCPDCGKVAIKFDETMYLTLQLPIERTFQGLIYWVPLDSSQPRIKVQYLLKTTTKDFVSFRQLKVHLGKLLGRDPDRMAAVEDWSGKPWKIWQDTDCLQGITDRDVINFFETPLPFAALKDRIYMETQSDLLIPVVSHRPAERGLASCSADTAVGGSLKSTATFGVFFVVRMSVADRMSYQSVYDAIVREYSRYTKHPEDLFERDEEDAAPEESDGTVRMQDGDDGKGAAQGVDRFRGGRCVADLFKISVPRTSSPTVFPTSNAMTGPTIELRERIQRENAQHSVMSSPQPPPTSVGANSKVGWDETEDLYEDHKHPTAEPGYGPSSRQREVLQPRQPVVRVGDYFECEWSLSAMGHFFGLDRSLPESRGWNDPALIKDPELVAQQKQDHQDSDSDAVEEEQGAAREGGDGFKAVADDEEGVSELALLASEEFVINSHPTRVKNKEASEGGTKAKKKKKRNSKEEEPDKKKSTGGPRGSGHLTIQECFKDFSKPEKLGEDDKWYCPRCKGHVQAIKRMEIWKVPDILVVHFKRFSSHQARSSASSYGYGRMSKMDEYVDFPIEGLDLTQEVESVRVKRALQEQQQRGGKSNAKTMAKKQKKKQAAPVVAGNGGGGEGEDGDEAEKEEEGGGGGGGGGGEAAAEEEEEEEENDDDDDDEEEKFVYDLFAVDNHYGGLGGGHYTAFAKNEEDGKWHHYDDSHVSEVSSPERVKTAAAYLLFYRRRSRNQLGGSKTDEVVRAALVGGGGGVLQDGESRLGAREAGEGRHGSESMKMDEVDVEAERVPGASQSDGQPPQDEEKEESVGRRRRKGKGSRYDGDDREGGEGEDTEDEYFQNRSRRCEASSSIGCSSSRCMSPLSLGCMNEEEIDEGQLGGGGGGDGAGLEAGGEARRAGGDDVGMRDVDEEYGRLTGGGGSGASTGDDQQQQMPSRIPSPSPPPVIGPHLLDQDGDQKILVGPAARSHTQRVAEETRSVSVGSSAAGALGSPLPMSPT